MTTGLITLNHLKKKRVLLQLREIITPHFERYLTFMNGIDVLNKNNTRCVYFSYFYFNKDKLLNTMFIAILLYVILY